MSDLRGVFGGVVEDNQDPQKLGRLKIRVAHVYGAVGGAFGAVATNNLPWALPVGLPSGFTQQSGGMDWLPEVGDQVLVQFMDAEPEKPVWNWMMQSQDAQSKFPLHSYAKGSQGSVGKPNRGALVRYGHTIEWNTDGIIETTSKGYRILLTDASAAGNDGDITIQTQGGQYIDFDDSTGDTTLNVNHDWNINVENQILAIADSASLTTVNNEIELKAGSDLTVETEQNLEGTIHEDWSMTVTGKTVFDLTGDYEVNGSAKISLSADTDLNLEALANMAVKATGTLDLASTGPMTVKSDAAMSLDFIQLSIGGASAISPYVLGDQLLAYLNTLFTILSTHTHPGVQSGPSATGPMTPPPIAPTAALLSSVVKGR